VGPPGACYTTGLMPERTPTSHTLVLALAAIATLIALLLWNPLSGSLPASEPEPEPAPRHARAVGEPAPASAPGAPGEPALASEACESRATAACHEGDLWWFDGCGAPEVLAEPCEGRACLGDRCAEDPRCAQASEYGVCEGDRAIACLGGRLVTIDCSAKGQRCVDTREGARCVARDPVHGCGPRDLASCKGDKLRECVDGLWAEIDCAARKASCIADGGGARCGPSVAPPALPALELELCGGDDEDQDGNVDEDAACEPVPLVAFVPEGAQLTELEARMERELDTLNRALSPLRFAWARTVQVPENLAEVNPDRLMRISAQLSQQESTAAAARARAAADAPAGLPFYIPVLFAERLRIEPPKSGLSTLPNAACGGVRVSDAPSPPYGLIVLANERTPETLTHELGHYLGLCHTHEELDRIAAASPDLPACRRTGDGICDTPDDRGPRECYAEENCDYYCPASSARPDASNLMSYYMTCRHAFSPEQVAEAARVLALRRGWFRCLDPSDCPCDPALAQPCPAAMSCHPGANDAGPWTCELEGPGLPGTACRGSSQCAQGTVCLGTGTRSGRCVRLCSAGAECDCVDATAAFKVCREDLDAN
jgi:Pregnancy-associated plasma protein-A